ncbi:MAG: hypothetical protein OEU92_13850 [Alphaproteobacteria bacterium]|nr:hypothetical protein [Alphaproteobacteria bacterium]
MSLEETSDEKSVDKNETLPAIENNEQLARMLESADSTSIGGIVQDGVFTGYVTIKHTNDDEITSIWVNRIHFDDGSNHPGPMIYSGKDNEHRPPSAPENGRAFAKGYGGGGYPCYSFFQFYFVTFGKYGTAEFEWTVNSQTLPLGEVRFP